MPHFKRDLFTGELIEEPLTGEGRVLIGRIEPPEGAVDSRHCAPWSRDWVSRSMGVHPSEVPTMNEEARRHNTGAHYREDGSLVCSTRKSRKLEVERRGFYDASSYGLGGDPRV
jgi:hypothetical protein